MKSRFNTLIYLQDPGGTNFIKNNIDFLKKNYQTKLAAHNLSLPAINSLGISPDFRISNLFSFESWINFLEENKIKKVITTLSSKYVDMANCNLIKASKVKNIASMGFFDHWKGYDRLLEGKELTYATDEVCVIDHFVKKNFVNLGFAADKIYEVGHPALEKRLINRVNFNLEKKKILKICVLSQPDTVNKTFESIFLSDKNIFLEKLKTELDASSYNFELYIRHHPKEKILVSDTIKKDKLDWDSALNFYDIFIGVNSMTLIEAFLYGKKAIFIDPKNFNVSDDNFPYCISNKCVSYREVFKFLISNESHNANKDKEKFCDMLIDSNKRLKIVLEKFLN